MTNAITYIRVSATEQADKRNSLENQELAIADFMALKKENQLQIFKENFSAKNFNRPAWKELIKYAKANRKTIDKLYVLRWDRFSRNVKGTIKQMDYLKSLGIRIESVEDSLDIKNRA